MNQVKNEIIDKILLLKDDDNAIEMINNTLDKLITTELVELSSTERILVMSGLEDLANGRVIDDAVLRAEEDQNALPYTNSKTVTPSM